MSAKILKLSLLAWTFVVTGCQTPSDETNANGEQGATFSTIKPGAAVALDYALEGETELGTPVTVQLELTSANAADAMQLSLNSDEALQLSPEQSSVAFQGVQPGIVQTHRVQVTPQRSGRLYINAIVTVDSGGVQSARTFTVPIQVGPEVADKDEAPDDGSEQIISLPAEES